MVAFQSGTTEERVVEIIEGEGASIVGQIVSDSPDLGLKPVYAVEVPVGEEQEFVKRFEEYEEVTWAGQDIFICIDPL